MSATIAVTTNEIREIFQGPTASPSRLWELAKKINTLAITVENSWDKLPSQKRDLMTAFAYSAIEPSSGIKDAFVVFIRRLFLALVLVVIVFQGEENAFIAYANALQRLVNAILSAIERENKAYQKALLTAVEETLNNRENSKAMTAEEACERIRILSDKVLG